MSIRVHLRHFVATIVEDLNGLNEELSLNSQPGEYEFVSDFFEEPDKVWHVFTYRPGDALD